MWSSFVPQASILLVLGKKFSHCFWFICHEVGKDLFWLLALSEKIPGKKSVRKWAEITPNKSDHFLICFVNGCTSFCQVGLGIRLVHAKVNPLAGQFTSSGHQGRKGKGCHCWQDKSVQLSFKQLLDEFAICQHRIVSHRERKFVIWE